jgi:hypothetical protein
MVGAFVTEPKGSSWPTKGEMHGDVMAGKTTLFREFVNVLQNNVYLYPNNALPPSNTATFFNAINYSSNSMAYRFNGQNGENPTNATTISDAFSNTHVVPPTAAVEWGDPAPVWVVERKMPFRLRMVHPDGLGGFPDDVIKLHGHVYAEEPYIDKSTRIGLNPKTNWTGAREGFGAGNQFDIVIPSAGGILGIPGDYLLASFPAAEQANGNWALVRVCDTHNLKLFPCTTAAVAPPTGGPTYEQLTRGTAHNIPPPPTSGDRFLLRTNATTHTEPGLTIHVPANTPPPPPPGGSNN